VADSARLLKHEQGHFDINCVLAKRANMALWVARDSKMIKPRDLVDAAADARDRDDYDIETNHGCKPVEQASWETDIAGGLVGLWLLQQLPIR
jgi:hypothetical protein